MTEVTQKGLAVDIDETLSGTVSHWIERMLEKFGNPENLSVKELIEKYRYTKHVPYWQQSEVLSWIDEQVHSDELHEELPLIEDANIILRKINEIIPVAAYITARPEVVRRGTERWLKKHRFPLAPVMCRPIDVPHDEGNKWKAGTLIALYPSIIGIIDDNAALLEYLGKEYQGTVFLYDHHEDYGYSNVVPCKNWLMVYEAVKSYCHPKKAESVEK